MDAETKAAFESLAELIEDHSQSLEQEFRAIEQDLGAGFDRIEAATAHNTGMLTAGTRAVGSLQSWARQRDQQDRRRDLKLRDLDKRLTALERALKRRRA